MRDAVQAPCSDVNSGPAVHCAAVGLPVTPLPLTPLLHYPPSPGLVIFSFLVVEPQDIGFLPQSGSVVGSIVRS